MIKRRIIITGSPVTDVGFRVFLLSLAETIGFDKFFARNIGINEVEVFLEGEAEAIERFISDIKSMKPGRVEIGNIIIEEYDGEIRSIESFYRVLSSEQLSKIIDVGLSMVDKQDQMLGKQDQMLLKQDMMLQKQDQMLVKQDEILSEIKDLRKDLRSLLDDRLRKIEEDIALIKARLGLKE